MLFPASVQPSIISLFSSTGSDPLALFRTSVDKSLPSDSFLHILHDQHSSPPPPPPASLLHLPKTSQQQQQDDSPSHGYELDQTVLHIQSPTIQTTYIQCPKAESSDDKSNALGVRHPWMHLQVRNLGREWAFEVGIVDHAGRVGIVRLSTFQKRPRLKLNHQKAAGSPPLLLLPLSFPSHSAYPLTPWNTINIHLPSFLPYFSSPSLYPSNDDERDPARNSSTTSLTVIPGGTYSHVSYVRVYANCRLRRIWFGDGDSRQKVPWEFELYSV